MQRFHCGPCSVCVHVQRKKLDHSHSCPTVCPSHVAPSEGICEPHCVPAIALRSSPGGVDRGFVRIESAPSVLAVRLQWALTAAAPSSAIARSTRIIASGASCPSVPALDRIEPEDTALFRATLAAMTRSLWTVALVCAACSPATSPTDAGAMEASSVDGSTDAAQPDASEPDASEPSDSGTCAPLPTPRAFVRSAAAAHASDATLRLNHLQAKATHNSYHLLPRVQLAEWNYEHAPIPTQLEMQGVRGIELDLNYNARCGRFEVYHVISLDDRTTCRQFTDCLLAVRDFSERHPGHHPLFVHIEPKGGEGRYDEGGFAEIEREILSVFDRSWIITPDEVRGESATLREAVTTRGWPTLAQSRGRVLFYLDNTTAPRAVYTHNNRDLAGRLMFVDSRVGDPFAAVMVLNDPIAQRSEIASALTAGYLVRTRADSDPTVAMTNDRAQLTAALASGAQIVSTDFPARTMGSDYVVEIPDGTPSRCSSVTAPMGCTPALIEDPARVSLR